MAKKKLLNFLDSFEVYLGSICMAAMIILLFLQVFSRYIMGHAFSWTEELALIFFILSVYFGATAAIRKNQHLRMSILLEKFGFKGRSVILIISDLFFMLFNCVLLTGLIAITMRLKANDVRTAVTNIPKWNVYIFLPFLFFLMNLRLVQDIYFKIKIIKNGPTENLTVEQQLKKAVEG